MPNRFIALPVNQGDAFYLEKGVIKILVDGGNNKTQIVSLLESYCAIHELDVLICTHNDSDHANGVLGLLQNWGRVIKEVWLPGSWTYRLHDMVNQELFYNELISDIMKSKDDASKLSDLKLDINSDRENCNDFKEETNMELVFDSLNQHDNYLLPICNCCLTMMLDIKHDNKVHLIHEAITAANRIMDITKEAYIRGCKIRFFEYGTPDGNTIQTLQPINSKEIVRNSKRSITALEFLALSVSNKESLVFLSPETDNLPAVLFTADSDLAFLPSSPVSVFNNNLIVTASHHGSEENNCIYSRVINWSNATSANIHWVRSDCKSNRRPCPEFKQQNSKYCTRCNPYYSQQAAAFEVNSGNWIATMNTNGCTCR
jgi:hypothetical protein